MKKLLTLIVLLVIFTSCQTKTFKEDPSLKESERISVLEKAKTDTLNIIIKVDNTFYIVNNNKIERATSENMLSGDGLLLAFFIGMLFCGLIILVVYIAQT